MSFGKVFIFEGLDYTGKTTTLNFCKEKLEELFPGKVVSYRSPGGTILGETLRDIARIEAKTIEEQIFLYLTCISSVKAQVDKDILEGKIVLLDRWCHSTLVYQISYLNKNLQIKFKEIIEELFSFKDCHYFLFDISFETLEKRINASEKTDTVDRFENSKIEEKKVIFNNYQTLFNKIRRKDYGYEYEHLIVNTEKLNLEMTAIITLGEILKKVKND